MYDGVTAKVLAEIHQEDVKTIKELREELSIYKELVSRYQKIINLNNIDKISEEIRDLKGQLIVNTKNKFKEVEELMNNENNRHN